MKRNTKTEETGNQQKKTVRSLSITQNAWDAIKDKAAREKISASEFLERIGRDASVLETPIHSRLKAFLEAPISIWWCWSEATRRYAVQLGLVENHREEGLKDYIVEERLKRQKEIVGDCLWRAMLTLAVINYGIPELSINSMTPLLRWMSFKMLLHRAEQAESHALQKTDKPTFTIAQEQIETDLAEIQAALDLLQQFSPSYYEVLDMVMKGRMSFAQIAKYKRLNTQRNVTEAEARREAKEAVYQLRAYLHNKVTNIAKEQYKKSFCKSENALEAKKKEYYQLCSLSFLKEKDTKDLEERFLRSSLEEPELEFWIKEIDHLAGHYLGKFESIHTDSKHKDLHYELREEIEKKLKDENTEEKDSLRTLLTQMDKKLMFCKSFKDIRETVEQFVSDVSQGSLQLDTIPLPKSFLERKE
ncbi:hypothetical protein [Mastigocladopsis repens]|uniref:hypothetical protein n=1 Tax=Mastigocladopsis repens TaxID=221287 RepID=UPI0002D84B89|nr:hypothetical protein [Mastigocladopsis repens]